MTLATTDEIAAAIQLSMLIHEQRHHGKDNRIDIKDLARHLSADRYVDGQYDSPFTRDLLRACLRCSMPCSKIGN